MFQWVPTRAIRWINPLSFIISYKCLISQADIVSKFKVSICQAIELYPITLQIFLNFSTHSQPKSLRVLYGNIKTKIASKLTFIELWIIFSNINSDFPSSLRALCLFYVNGLHTTPAIHLHK